jgi:hypothetical protein
MGSVVPADPRNPGQITTSRLFRSLYPEFHPFPSFTSQRLSHFIQTLGSSPEFTTIDVRLRALDTPSSRLKYPHRLTTITRHHPRIPPPESSGVHTTSRRDQRCRFTPSTSSTVTVRLTGAPLQLPAANPLQASASTSSNGLNANATPSGPRLAVAPRLSTPRYLVHPTNEFPPERLQTRAYGQLQQDYPYKMMRSWCLVWYSR